ncbi:hypothetical protein EAI_15674, partial [Harpegnathos saltator]
PVVIAGDFNAHSEGWGCSPRQRDPWGEAVISWAAGLGLLSMNRGSTSTCVRPGGQSVIDLTWATPSAAGLFQEWRVEAEGESLSDHRYIVWTLRLNPHR